MLECVARPGCPVLSAWGVVDAALIAAGCTSWPRMDLRGDGTMARPVTLVTGQWADMSLEELAAKAKGWGYDGLELGC